MENFRPNSNMNVGNEPLVFDAYGEYHNIVTITNCGRVITIDKHLMNQAFSMKDIKSIVYKTSDTAQVINIKFKDNSPITIYCKLESDLFTEQYLTLIDWWNKAL